MQNSSRFHEPLDPRSFAARKGHLPQLSISDDNHHVTEAIGYMYGDEDSPSSPRSSGRYSIRSDKSLEGDMDTGGRRSSLPRKPIPDYKVVNGERKPPLIEVQPKSAVKYRHGWDDKNGISPVSPLSARESSPSETATTQFPLNDIDYESSPAAVAQELSNLQALRRMSMDIGAAGDPDLPQLNAAALPSAPSPTTSDDDSARLFWVPARLHPELAPKEFKSFLESKAEQIKRRSGELSSFSSPTTSRSSSLSSENNLGSLRRKKSMLSRQIDSSIGYQDGADRLELKKSQEQTGQSSDPNLEDLESMVSNATGMPRLSLENRVDEETGDIILPSIPGSSLKRSTRTKYQRPDSRKGAPDRSTYAERAKRRAAAAGTSSSDNSPVTPIVPLAPSDSSISGFSEVSNLASTLKDPTSDTGRPTTNFSRPGNRSPSPPLKDVVNQVPTIFDSVFSGLDTDSSTDNNGLQRVPSRGSSSSAFGQVSERPIPQIVESPPVEDHPVRTSSMAPPPSNVYSIKAEPAKQNDAAPPRERPKTAPSTRPGMPPKQSSTLMSSKRPTSRGSNLPPQTPPTQTLEQPSPLPGHDTNTSNLSFIPTLNVDKRPEQRKKEEKKSSWGWFTGKEGSDKDKDKSKSKGSRTQQNHDSTRLDVLQTSIDGGPKGRESLVLDRESLKLEEERKKESLRKTSGTEKKEREGIFSSLFGKKSRAEKDAQRRAQERLSPEPPYRELKPDIDYNWTRFTILEERAIYRMAHIKLANPRRALYSQVLLSNFMYSYLAKVQQMHPQMNLPTSAKQQRKQKEQQQLQQQQQQQPDEFTQYQRYHQQQAQQAASFGSNGQSELQPGFDNDSMIYDFNYSRESPRPDSRSSQQGVDSPSSSSNGHYGVGGNSYTVGNASGSSPYHQQSQQHQRQQQGASGSKHDNDDDDDDMW